VHRSSGIFLDQALISYRYCFCCCVVVVLVFFLVLLVVGADLFIKAERSVVSNQIGMTFGRIVLQVNMHRLTESDFDTSYVKVLPSGECTRSVYPAHMQQRPPVPDP